MPSNGSELDLADAALETWDAVIVGCGVGGATLGYALVQRGQRVLFVEAGLGPDQRTKSATYPEMSLPSPDAVANNLPFDALLQHGRQTSPILDMSAGRRRSFIPFIGKGAGGSSQLYGMAMERFQPQDFQAASGDERSALRSDAWPIAHQDLIGWYEQAEALYGVRGGHDPLNDSSRTQLPPAPSLDSGHAWLDERLRAAGLTTYRLPLACRDVPSCGSCQGHLCQERCKISSAEACLLPALKSGRARIVSECTALRLESTRTQVTGVVCEKQGASHVVRARKFVLALGALYTPALLLRSASADWSNGLANDSGWVGRGLMRHGIDLYAITMPSDLVDTTDNRTKSLAFNDFYIGQHGGLGTVQSFGRLPPVQMLTSELVSDLKRQLPMLPKAMAELGAVALTPILKHLESRTLILAATMEDSAAYENFVAPGPDTFDPASITMRYQLTRRDQARMRQFRRELGSRFKELRFQRIKQMTNNERIAHACGTCRAGLAPTKSVVNAENRAHSMDNLWVCDASFLPSSGGTNPSLTIAANALRVAACM